MREDTFEMYKKWLAIGFMTLGTLLFCFFVWTKIPLSDSFLGNTSGNIFLDRNGQTLFMETSADGLYQLPRSKLEEISPYFLVAAVRLEDRRFFLHKGLNYAAILRAIAQNIRYGEVISGGSTLTLQLAKLLNGHTERTLAHKITEVFFAKRLEAQFSKGDIFSLWANTASFSGNIVGIRSASEFYFHKSPKDLTLAEAAYLAGIPRSPEKYSPVRHPNAAKARQEDVLRLLLRDEIINQEEYDLAISQELMPFTRSAQISAPHFVMNVRSQKLKSNPVTTSLDVGIQEKLENIIRRHLDFLREHNAENAAAIVIENSTGAIRAYAGNADFFNADASGQVDVLRSYRQAGSVLKPFLYYLAFRDLDWSADSKVLDEPMSFLTDKGTPFSPKNFDLKYRGEITVREALGESRNVPAVATLASISVEKFFHLFKILDITPLQTADAVGLSAALGAAEMRPIELARAYTILAREGQSVDLCMQEPCVTQIGDQILNKNIVLEITDILSDEVARINAFGEKSPLDLPFEIAVKTGTSRNFRDNYTVGYTSHFTVFVWVGNNDGSPMKEISGVTGAGPIFHDIVEFLAKVYPLNALSAAPPREFKTTQAEGFRLITPVAGTVFALDPSRPEESQKIRLEASEVGEFFINGNSLGTGKEILWIPIVGEHEVIVKSSAGESANVEFTVR